MMPPILNSLRRDSLTFVMIFSGLIGFLIGISHASWQHAVEGAQVLAGVVSYPSSSPHFLYQTNAWTILHQIPAFFLKLGVSEIVLSVLISGLMGTLSYQCLGAAFFIFSGDKRFSLLLPPLVDSLRLLKAGLPYPIILTGEVYTYGSIALSSCMLSILLISQSRNKSGGFLLGLLPAIHLGLGLQTIFLCLVTVLLFNRTALRRTAPWFLMGSLLTVFSAATYPFTDASMTMGTFSKTELAQFIYLWDFHRTLEAFSFSHWLMIVGLFASWLFALNLGKHNYSDSALFFLRFLAVFSGWGLCALALWHIPLNKLPQDLLRLMPTRINNFSVFIYPAFLLGSLKSNPRKESQLLFYLFILAAMIIFDFAAEQARQSMGIALFLAFFGFFYLSLTRKNLSLPIAFLLRSIERITVVYLIFKTLSFALPASPAANYYSSTYSDQSRHHVLRLAASEKRGFLLTSPDLQWMQLKTRRPILADLAAIDVISYFPNLGPPIRAIISAIYGFDILSESESKDYLNGHLTGVYTLWLGRSVSDWKEIRRDYNVTQILTSSWELKLPKIAQSGDYILYAIPEN